MATTRTQCDQTANQDLLRGGIRNVFDSTGGAALTESGTLYNMVSTSEFIERDARMAMLDHGGKVLEGEQIPIQDPKFGQKLDYEQEKYGTGFRITMEMKIFNKIELVKRLTKSLKKIMLETKDVELAKLWNSPTATYTGFTGVVLGSASQTTLDDAATGYDNLGGSALGTTSLQDGMYYFDTLVDDQGNSAPKRADCLYYQPTLQWTANELMRSSDKPHEFSNTINTYKDWDLKLFNYHRLTSTTAWGMACKKDEAYDINCFTSREPDLVFEGPFDTTRDTLVTSAQLFDWGFGDPRCVFIGNT